ncbi:MAG TPA: hypothetical protein VFH43_14595 [Candidatus Kapabacteria bacterium]|nr:hypothetical protein [Candidatus Kapabacteria bacterium]
MRKPDQSIRNFSTSPVLLGKSATAHSGIELIESLPFAEQAAELVHTLLLDRMQLTQSAQISTGGFIAPVYALNRR